MNTNYVYPSAQVGEFRNAMLYASGPASYAPAGDTVYNPGSSEYINFPSDCTSLSGNYRVRFVPSAVGLNQIRAGGGVNGPSQSGWTAHWNYAPAAFSPDGLPLTLGTLSAAGTQSTYTAAGLVTVATTTPPPLGSFISLSNGASNYGIEFNGLIVYVSAVVPGVSYSFYAGQGSANHYTVNTDTLKWQQVQVSASNVLQALPLSTQITGVLATTALLTITQVLTAAQAASLPGQFVLLNGPFKTASAFAAGVIVQVATASTTGWTANWQGTVISQTSAETAVASLLVTNGNVPVQCYPYVSAPTAAISNVLAVASDTTHAGLLTLTATQGYQAGQIAVVQSVATATQLNGSIGTIIASGLTSALVKLNAWSVITNTAADTGVVSLLVTGSPPLNMEVPAGTNLSAETVQFAALVSSL